MKQIFRVRFVPALLAIVITAGSCKKDKTPAPVAFTNDINIASSVTLGQYLADKNGLALYMFADDADGASTCTGDCEKIWPAFTADLATAKLDTGLKATDFATITNAAGKKQVTYRGWPLHTFSPAGTDGYGNNVNVPEAAGKTGGDGFLGVWFVAKPDYTIMLADKQLTGLDGKMYKSDYTQGVGKTVYFTDGAGKTIYTFSLDSFNTNKLTNADASNNDIFPIYEQEKIVVPSVLNKALFQTITAAGKKQLTYKGWPLYHFGQDLIRGSNKGVGAAAPGVFPVAVKDMAEAAK